MEIDVPEVVAERRAEFDRYEKALDANDVVTLNAMFHGDSRTILWRRREPFTVMARSNRFVSRARLPVHARYRGPSSPRTTATMRLLRRCSIAPARLRK
jgi:hypothetical protein